MIIQPKVKVAQDKHSSDSSIKEHHVIFIPGFLTEPHQWSVDPIVKDLGLDELDPTRSLDSRAWRDALRAALPQEVSLEILEWPSQSLLKLIKRTLDPFLSNPKRLIDLKTHSKITLLNLVKDVQKTWAEAYQSTDQAAHRLIEILSAHQSPTHQSSSTSSRPPKAIYIIGHSLGGRIALQTVEKIIKHQRRELELSVDSPVDSSVDSPVELRQTRGGSQTGGAHAFSRRLLHSRAQRKFKSSSQQSSQILGQQILGRSTEPLISSKGDPNRLPLSIESIDLKHIYTSAWAPAIRQNDLAWEHLAKVPHPPEVMYSREDQVLRYLFPLGDLPSISSHPLKIIDQIAALFDLFSMSAHPESHSKAAAGLIGPPLTYDHHLDLSSYAVTHLTYLTQIPMILSHSRALDALFKGL